MSSALALIDTRITVASLRKPDYGLYVSKLSPEGVSPSRLTRLATLSVTLIRVPIILFGIIALAVGWMVAACLSFVLFALLDYFDGVAARQVGQDTAIRRLGDVLLDRISIHVVIMMTCLHYDSGWLVWGILLLRDLLQGAFSSYLLAKHRALVIGAYWHMLYGVAILVWECVFAINETTPLSLSICVVALALAIGADYVARCTKMTAL